MRYFLVVYDRARGEVVDLQEFSGAERNKALKARFALEVERRDDASIEIVVLGAESREALERTHARYFKTPGELASAAGV